LQNLIVRNWRVDLWHRVASSHSGVLIPVGFELPQSQRLHQTLPGTKQRKDIQIVRIKQLQNLLGAPTQFGEPSMSNIL
jgi:hypothetical protein